MLNVFDERKGRRWYRIFIAEDFVRRIATKFANSWHLCLFCCCREDLDTAKHTGCFKGPEAAALQAYQTEQKEEQEELSKGAQGPKELTKALEQQLNAAHRQIAILSDRKAEQEDAEDIEAMIGPNEAPEEEVKTDKLRGDNTSLLPKRAVINIVSLYGAPPGRGISSTSRIVRDIRRSVFQGYSRADLTLIAPDFFAHLEGSDCNFEAH